MIAWTSVFCRILSIRAFSTLRILPRIGRIAWIRGSRPPLAEPPAESPSTMKTSHSSGLVDWQSLQLAGQPAAAEQALAVAGLLAGLAGRDPGDRRGLALADDQLALAGVLLEPVAQPGVHHLLHEGPRLGVAQLGLGLALELRLGQLDRDDRGQPLPDVVAGQPVLGLLDHAPVLAPLVGGVGQRGPEALLVGAALVGVDRVGEGVHRLLVGHVPLHRDLDADPGVGPLGLDRDHRVVHRSPCCRSGSLT